MKSSAFDVTKLMLGAALILGAIVRFAPTLMAGFPINDGGMFLSMIRDLHTSKYVLPATTSYNFSNIPFAYPPLGFYLARLLADLGLNEILVLRFLPALAATCAIYGMYLLTSVIIRSPEISAASALIYALAPRSYTWLVMGGGLTRALGFCLILFVGWAVCQLFQTGSRKWLVTAILCSGLTVLSHPEATVYAVALCALMWLFYGRTRAAAIQAVLVAAGTVLLCAPWWGTVLAHVGLEPFRSVLNTGLQGASPAATYWRAIYPNDSILPVLSILFVGALIWGFWKKQYFLLLWTVIPVIVEPRSALNVVVFPLSMLLAGLLLDLKIYFQSKGAAGMRNSMLGFFVLILYLFSESYLFSRQLVNVSLTQADRTTMTWIREHAMVDSRFALLTGVAGPELDAFQEWFPALAERKSMTTFQGTEWTLGPQFLPWLRELRSLQACTTAVCVQTWVNKNQVRFDYIVVKKYDRTTELLASLRSDASYETIYEDAAAVIFAPQ